MPKINTGFLNRMGNVFDSILKTYVILASIIVAFMMFGITVDVVLRYFFNKPIRWMHEIVSFGILWVTFLGASWTLKNDAHVKIDILLKMLKPKNAKVLTIITSIFGVLICGVLIWFTAVTTWKYRVSTYVTSSDRRFIVWPIVAIIPFGFLHMLILYIRKIVTNINLLKSPEMHGDDNVAERELSGD